jgi:hypothetical protein
MGAEVATWKLKKSIHVYEANLQMVFLATNTRCNSKKKKKTGATFGIHDCNSRVVTIIK